MDYALYFGMGALAGLISGLFGLGGGVVVVPGLAIVFRHLGLAPEYIMHMAAGTSLAVMMMTTFSSATSHMQLGTVNKSAAIRLSSGIVIGVMIGAVVADYLDTDVLSRIFGVFLGVVALRFFLMKGEVVKRPLPSTWVIIGFGVMLGCVSGMLGIGAGTMTVPFLMQFGLVMSMAAGTSAVCSFFIAVVGTVSFISTGWGSLTHLHYTTGYVYWPAFGFIGAASLMFAPIGARLATKWPVARLKRIFAVVLCVLGLHMLGVY